MAKNIILGSKLTSKKIWGEDSKPKKAIEVQGARFIPKELMTNGCAICGRTFKTPSGLYSHLRWHKRVGD